MTSPFIGVLPGDGFVIERVVERRAVDGLHTVKECLPLAGFGVRADGTVVVLPTDLGSEWSCRPALQGDDSAIRRTAAAMVQRPHRGLGSTLPPWVDDAT